MEQKRLLVGIGALTLFFLFAIAVFTPKGHEFASEIIFLSSSVISKLN